MGSNAPRRNWPRADWCGSSCGVATFCAAMALPRSFDALTKELWLRHRRRSRELFFEAY